jgi:hypothetical protein
VLQVKLLGTALHSLCELSTSPVVVDLTTVRLLLGWMTRYQQKQSSLEHAPLMILSLPAPAPPIAIALHVRLPNDVQVNHHVRRTWFRIKPPIGGHTYRPF